MARAPRARAVAGLAPRGATLSVLHGMLVCSPWAQYVSAAQVFSLETVELVACWHRVRVDSPYCV